MASLIRIVEGDIPSENPPADKYFIGIDSVDGNLYTKDENGNINKFLGSGNSGLFVSGAKVSFGTVSAVRIGTVGEASYVRDSTNVHTIVWNDLLNLDITTSGAGGLDTGVEAPSTWYAVYVIDDTTGVNLPDALLSTSFTSPTLPSGYDVFRRVGSIYNNSASDIRKFIQMGIDRKRRNVWDVNGVNLVALAAGNATVLTSVSLTALVPPTAHECRLNYAFDNTVATDEFVFNINGSTETFATATYRHRPGVIITITSDYRGWADMTITNQSQSIDYGVTQATNSLTFAVCCYCENI